MQFGIPPKRLKKTEKYDFPVLTMQREPEIKKGARRFTLNKTAVELLNLNKNEIAEFVSVGFPEFNNDNFVIANTTGLDIPNAQMMFHRSGNSFSDAKLYNAIKERFGITGEVDVYFKINDNLTFDIMINDFTNVSTLPHSNADAKHEMAEKEELTID